MENSRVTSALLEDIVKDAFLASHDGVSTDELLCDDALLASFDHTLQQLASLAGVTVDQGDGRWILLNIRKSGKLGRITTKRLRVRHDAYKHIAETAARISEDLYRTKIDRIMCDPDRRLHFDSVAKSYGISIPLKHIRLAAISLRKAKELSPLVGSRLLQPTTILLLPVAQILSDGSCVPRAPGLYVFGTSTHCLYVGEADNLNRRIVHEHCTHSDRKQLAEHLWKYGPDDVRVEVRSYAGIPQAKKKPIRRALEVELIRTRHPAFNIQGR
jgi:hypothetical protein